MTEPFVVAVEGTCYSGKTTLCRGLAETLTAITVADYGDLGPIPPFPPIGASAVADALLHFLDLERSRTARARTGGSSIVLLDRSPLTLIAHEAAIANLGVPADPAHAIELFASEADSGRILTPDAYLYLTISDSERDRRQRLRGAVPAHLVHPAVLAGIDRAYRTWFGLLPEARRMRLDGTAPTAVSSAAAARFIRTAAATAVPVPSWRRLHAGLGNKSAELTGG